MKKTSMNKRILMALCFLLFFSTSFLSCKRDHHEEASGQEGGPTPRPVGQPKGENATAIVGINGGTVYSEDGLLSIEVPSGALTEDTELGIQPLQPTAVSSVGTSYRLTPHGKQFKKKVTIRFNYWKYKEQLSSVYAPEIAFQQEDGQWTCPGGVINDTEQKVISVQTDHFSDWGLVASMELSPVIKTIGLSQSVSLKALRYVFPLKGDDWIVPLASPLAGTGEPMKIEENYIVKWQLNGPGTLIGKGAEATYTAPASIQGSHATATITVELNVQGKQVLLISTINIITDGISISIDGAPFQTYPGMAVNMPDLFRYSLSSLRISSDIPQIVFMWPENDKATASGRFNWSMHDEDNGDVTFEYDDPALQFVYVSIFQEGPRTFDSGGYLQIEETMENGKKYVCGSFVIDNAGFLYRLDGNLRHTANLKGSFKVQRNW